MKIREELQVGDEIFIDVLNRRIKGVFPLGLRFGWITDIYVECWRIEFRNGGMFNRSQLIAKSTGGHLLSMEEYGRVYEKFKE